MKMFTSALALLTAVDVSAAPNTVRAAFSQGNLLQKIVTEARSWRGTPYRYSGENRNGIDCSHFVFSVYSKMIPSFSYRMAREYLSDPSFVESTPPRAGDLIVFPGHRGASDHVGIVTDPQAMKFIGSQTSTGVAETSFTATTYWGKRPYRIMRLKNMTTIKNPEKPLPVIQ